MTPKIFLTTAALLVVCGSANAFNLGSLIQKGSNIVGQVGGSIGDTSCTQAKCGNPQVGADTVGTCFLRGAAVIQQNPNCTEAFWTQQCTGQQTAFGNACQAIASATGKIYGPAAAPQGPAAGQGQMTPAQQQAQMPQMNQGFNPNGYAAQQGMMPQMNQGFNPNGYAAQQGMMQQQPMQQMYQQRPMQQMQQQRPMPQMQQRPMMQQQRPMQQQMYQQPMQQMNQNYGQQEEYQYQSHDQMEYNPEYDHTYGDENIAGADQGFGQDYGYAQEAY